nr:hypothetical protein [Xerocomus impolitus]
MLGVFPIFIYLFYFLIAIKAIKHYNIKGEIKKNGEFDLFLLYNLLAICCFKLTIILIPPLIILINSF